jgi:hypothetical protein
MENKYYTPDISDLHIGYECEWKDCDEYAFEKKDEYPWESITIEELDLENLVEDLEEGRIRTPYLTKEQLEAEGWICIADIIYGDGVKLFKKDIGNYTYDCRYNILSTRLTIELRDYILDASKIKTNPPGKYSLDIVYNGFCSSINEFRYICKLLNIK